VSPPDVTQPDPLDTDYTVTVTNVGLRPTSGVAVLAVTRDADGQVLDEATTALPDPSPLAPGATRTVTVQRHGDGAAPVGTPMFSATGVETLSTPAIGAYDPDTVGGRLSTSWRLGQPLRCSTRIIRFTATSPPTTVAHGTTSATGRVTLRFALRTGFLYTFLVDPSSTCGPYRFNDLSLKGAISVTARVPRSARRGQRFTVEGTASGARKGDLVMVQRKSGGPWVTLGRGSVRAGGRFRIQVSLSASGRQTLRVFVPHTSFHFGAASATVPLLVATT
jgi:hypothetical protein